METRDTARADRFPTRTATVGNHPQQQAAVRDNWPSGGSAVNPFTGLDRQHRRIDVALLGTSAEPASGVGEDVNRKRGEQREVGRADRHGCGGVAEGLEGVRCRRMLRRDLAVQCAEHGDVGHALDGQGSNLQGAMVRFDGLNLYFGGANAVACHADGRLTAAGDPRRDCFGIVL